ncbi:MAG TPA: AAA family ATPase, partial [Candidatus Lustribacter sp.]|nr:AAA family ATPase [Candidatus Lustribacter sp.]
PSPVTGPADGLRQSLDALAAVAARAGADPRASRLEGLTFAAAIAESAPRAAADWAGAAGLAPAVPAPGAGTAAPGPGFADERQNRAFFDAASRGRKWRQAPTTLLSLLVAQGSPAAADYARALTEVASAACLIGEVSMRVTGNASVAAAAQLAAVPARFPDVYRPTGTQLPVPDGIPGDDALGTTADQLPGIPQGVQGQAAPASPNAPNGQPAPPAKTVEELLAELDALIGLARVKREVHRQVALLTVEQKREKAGLKSATMTRHLVFVGNPGTGKTTVARMVGGIYRALGLLSQGQLVEVDRSELVAGYLGQTAIKTAEVCAKSTGGVLFIDEAYALGGDQYGAESVNTLVKEMEDRRDDLVVIVAGYPDPMVAFIGQNPGLASRFTTTIEFEDYSDDELVAILHSLAAAADYDVTPAAQVRFREILAATPRTRAFGNGRFARNLLEQAIGRHAWRLREAADPSTQELRDLLPHDFEERADSDPPPAQDTQDTQEPAEQGPELDTTDHSSDQMHDSPGEGGAPGPPGPLPPESEQEENR